MLSYKKIYHRVFIQNNSNVDIFFPVVGLKINLNLIILFCPGYSGSSYLPGVQVDFLQITAQYIMKNLKIAFIST